MIPSERMTEAVALAQQHWQTKKGLAKAGPFALAVSREAGTYGAAVARAVGNRLRWPVYDRELLQCIADDLGIRQTLLESVDERHENWLSECFSRLFSSEAVSQSAYFHRLVEILLSLATHGEFVVVGRGASQILPRATTLRVRIVAPLTHRIEAVQREHHISSSDAAARVEATDRERNRFIKDHFQIDPADPANYDVVLNAARYSIEQCVDIVMAALDVLRKNSDAEHAPPALATAKGTTS